ncbi:MAG: hypothetical protein HY695_33965 [Deltaproteobacteria bacterium]|nr:hypothetical protein [Deltaproteobacteria bacterium]
MTSIFARARELWVSAKKKIVGGKEKIKSTDRRAAVAEIADAIRKAHRRENSKPNDKFVIQLSTGALEHLEELILREEQEIRIKEFLETLPSGETDKAR